MRLRGTAAAQAKRRSQSLAARLFLAQLVLVVIVCAALSITSYVTARAEARQATASRVLSIAETLANDPYVSDAVATADPSATLQPYALTVIATAKVDFVTIMDSDRTRYTHPDPEQLGKPYIGSIDTALDGHSQVEEYVGTLGPSVRAIVPIFDDAGSVTAMVSVGVTLETLSLAQAAALPETLIIALAAIAIGGIGSWIVSRYLRRVTLGYGPEQLKSLFAFYDSALHSLREGLVLVDNRGQLVLYNDQAAELLGLPARGEHNPIPVAELSLPASVRSLLASGRDADDEIHLTKDRVLVVNQKQATQPDGGTRIREGSRGTVATLRDRTDIQQLTGELESMTTLSEALRAQTHEHANRLHTVATLIELGREREALDFAVRDQQESQRLTDSFVQSLDEPFITALMIGKAAQAHERGIELTITAAGELPPDSLDARDLVTVTGNLLDNAFDAAAGSDARHVWADFAAADGELIITIADSGPGIDSSEIDAIFHLGESSKAAPPRSGGRGYGLVLVRQAVTRLGGTLDVDSDGGAIFTVTLPVTPHRNESEHDEGDADGS
ncbi:sensor histidine kinase [Microbacterium sp. MPKO10]|uniref:sensor histidine kinase n=1 Tax=Microbacterium sp. MPKO10 TaxID=2989818 RepID=UPI0022369881|nr:sensor histidine kinase [Microbacterium sp. MPKO10]MCW4457671.1 sensor histidine kinase [Microbacterium sp. MPKO10]